jgi:hypothetical protein
MALVNAQVNPYYTGMSKHFTLRKSGTVGKSLQLTVPRQIIRAHNLEAGDFAYYEQQPDGRVILKFVHGTVASDAPPTKPAPDQAA